ncbi:response regulator [Marivirga arenosa]|uniref:Response regulator n=1 Tax=Marivirga arenosa TaxID=3059076 RepID=A0AA49GIV0_9BACT|nr:response regulator [Marivirga sp. ABR2-2]WKK86279.1 response regulator [Marivirga sp. ABR2-2]
MKNIHILLVEDNEGDIILTQEALEDSKFINTVDVARNGKEAIDYLKRAEGYSKALEPDLILLDINLPIMSGHEVLLEIKNDEKLKHIPVIMLTTSSSDTDINKAYDNHANCYISKPVDIDEFMTAVAGIEHFWFSIVRLPNVKS